MRITFFVLTAFIGLVGCRTTQNSELASLDSDLKIPSLTASALLVKDVNQELQPCGVYTKLDVVGGVAKLSNYQHFAPNVFCPAVAIPANDREYNLKLVKKSFCGDTYEGSTGRDSIKITDYRNATCEIFLPAMLMVQETRKGETQHLMSKDNHQLPKPKPEPETIMVADSQKDLQACGVYTKMIFNKETITLSNWRFFHPAAFCTAIAIPADTRIYKVESVEKSFCGDTYTATNGQDSVELVDWSNALCEIVINSLYESKETRDGETTSLFSKDNWADDVF